MAQVPYTPVPQAQPIAPGEQVRVTAPPAAFGENIGAAIQHLGATTEQVGGELFSRAVAMKELENENEAREANMRLAEQQTTLNEKQYSLEGKQASDNLPGFIAQSHALKDQIRGSLSNPSAQRMFDSNAVGFLERSLIGAARHAGAEYKQYTKGSAEAQIQLLKEKGWVDPTDENEVQSKVNGIKNQLEVIGADGSLSPEQRELRMTKEISSLRLHQGVELAKQGRMEDAFKVLDEHVDDLTKDDNLRLTDQLRAQNRITGANYIARTVYGDGKTPQQMQKEARPLIEKLSHGDPDFEQHVFNAIDHKAFQVGHESRMQEAQNVQSVNELIGSGRFKTADEFIHDPQGGPLYHALTPGQQNSLQKRINSYWQPILKQQNDANYDHLLGASYGTFAQRMEVLNTDPFSVQMSEGQRQHILARQKALTANPMDDPRVIDAQRVAREHFGEELRQLGVLNVPRRGSSEEKTYLRWQGGLQAGVEELTKALGRPPTHDEIAEKVVRPLIRKHTESGFFGMLLGGRDVPTFKQTIPKEVLDTVKADLVKGGIENPTDSDVVNAVQRKQFIDLFAAQKLKGELGGRPAPSGPGKPEPGPE